MTYPGIENDKAALAADPDLAAVEARRAEREAEYGKYVALDYIPWGAVVAFTPGDAVPISTVERLKWDEMGLVTTRTSAAGREVLERTDSATTAEREAWAEKDKAAASRKAERESEQEKPQAVAAPEETDGDKPATSTIKRGK